MSEENQNNLSGNSPAVEDVFSEVDKTRNKAIDPNSLALEKDLPQPDSSVEKINISESSKGEKNTPPKDSLETKVESEDKNLKVNTGNILFYLILGLIILLGVFAIWVLLF